MNYNYKPFEKIFIEDKRTKEEILREITDKIKNKEIKTRPARDLLKEL